MKKKELIQLVIDGAGKRFGKRSAAIHTSNIFNTIAGQLFGRDGNQYNFYTRRVTITVANRVSTLTIPLIQTVLNQKGVIRILPTGADSDCLPEKTVFYPSPSYAIESSVDANKLSWAVFYTVTANTIRFNDSLPKEVTRLLADVVPEFQGYAEDDLIALPAGVAQMIIDAAVASLQGKEADVNIYKRRS